MNTLNQRINSTMTLSSVALPLMASASSDLRALQAAAAFLTNRAEALRIAVEEGDEHKIRVSRAALETLFATFQKELHETSDSFLRAVNLALHTTR